MTQIDNFDSRVKGNDNEPILAAKQAPAVFFAEQWLKVEK